MRLPEKSTLPHSSGDVTTRVVPTTVTAYFVLQKLASLKSYCKSAYVKLQRKFQLSVLSVTSAGRTCRNPLHVLFPVGCFAYAV